LNPPKASPRARTVPGKVCGFPTGLELAGRCEACSLQKDTALLLTGYCASTCKLKVHWQALRDLRLLNPELSSFFVTRPSHKGDTHESAGAPELLVLCRCTSHLVSGVD
jgi:hypothetical protein